MGIARLIVLVVAVALSVAVAIAPWVSAHVRAVGWTQYDVDCMEGLDIAVDTAGRVWAACMELSLEHVVRVFDGTAWTNGWHDQYEAEVLGLAAGPDGRVWALHEKAISVFDAGRRTMISAPAALGKLATISVDSRSRVWVDGVDAGADGQQGPTASVGIFDGSRWTLYTPRNSGLPWASKVNRIIFDGEGRAWIALGDAPLTTFDGARWATQPEMTSVSGLAVDRGGRAWTLRNGLYRYVEQRWRRAAPMTQAVVGGGHHRLAFDPRGRLWVVTPRSLTVLDGTSETILSLVNSGLQVLPRAIAADDRGRIWIAGKGGIQSFDSGTSRLTIRAAWAASLTERPLWPLVPGIGGTIWIALLLRSFRPTRFRLKLAAGVALMICAAAFLLPGAKSCILGCSNVPFYRLAATALILPFVAGRTAMDWRFLIAAWLALPLQALAFALMFLNKPRGAAVATSLWLVDQAVLLILLLDVWYFLKIGYSLWLTSGVTLWMITLIADRHRMTTP